LKNTFHLSERGLGLCMSASSACNAAVNGLLLAPAAALLGGGLRVVSTSVLSLALLALLQAAAAPGPAGAEAPAGALPAYLALLFAQAVFQFVLSTAITGESTARVRAEERGTLLGLEHSLFAAGEAD
jgi:hypothetical protein